MGKNKGVTQLSFNCSISSSEDIWWLKRTNTNPYVTAADCTEYCKIVTVNICKRHNSTCLYNEIKKQMQYTVLKQSLLIVKQFNKFNSKSL